MFGTAVFGLFCNLVLITVLHGGAGHDHGGGGGHGGHGGHGGGGHGDHGKKKEHSHGGKSHGEHGGAKEEHGGHGGEGKKKGKKKMSINEYAAYIHILGDLIQSIGVIIASIVIVIWPKASIADPISTILFACLVMMTTYKITK